MEDDDEMADYGTDLSDDVRVESIVDPHFDAKARPQQGSTVEIRSRRSFAGASREVPFKLRLNLTLSLVEDSECSESSTPDATTARVCVPVVMETVCTTGTCQSPCSQ